MAESPKHPSVFSDKLLPVIAEILIAHNSKIILDPFAGTGKIALIKSYGFNGQIHCVEMEKEWATKNIYAVDKWHIGDSQFLNIYPDSFFDAICTSPVYGNRLSDHHDAKDSSKRVSYTHFLGRKLTPGNTGQMQWGAQYRIKHQLIYVELKRVLKPNGIFVLNISDHVRNGKVIAVSRWHADVLTQLGLKLIQTVQIETPRMRFGKNAELRVPYENILVFKNS